jgi:hypothetical protein
MLGHAQASPRLAAGLLRSGLLQEVLRSAAAANVVVEQVGRLRQPSVCWLKHITGCQAKPDAVPCPPPVLPGWRWGAAAVKARLAFCAFCVCGQLSALSNLCFSNAGADG